MALFYVALLMLDYFNVALFDVALFDVALPTVAPLNIVLFQDWTVHVQLY